MTNQELIDKALYEVGVLASGESASATDSADVLDILNSMMAEWSVGDMNLNFPPQDTLGDAAPIPTWAELGVIGSLAIYAAPSFQAAIPEALAVKTRRGINTILRTNINMKLKGSDMSHLPLGDRSAVWDINTNQ